MDGRYDVIGIGSLLGVKGYGKEPRSIPVGSETVMDMYPLDFEEFLWGNLYGYKGAIFENLIADIFAKMGRKLYYFRKDSGLEVDFVIRYRGECTLVEVKAVTGIIQSHIKI